MLLPLRIKIKSLAAEAAIIRHEERRLVGRKQRGLNPDLPLGTHDPKRPGPKVRVGGTLPWLRAHQGSPELIAEHEDQYRSIHRHRTHDVRREARAALLAYAFLRGKPYRTVEAKGELPAGIAASALGIARRFGMPGVGLMTAEARFKGWLKGEAADDEAA